MGLNRLTKNETDYFVGCIVEKMTKEIYNAASEVFNSLDIEFEVFSRKNGAECH